MYFFSCKYPSSITVPNAGKRLLETVAKFLLSLLVCRWSSRGRGDLVSDDIFGQRIQIEKKERERERERERKFLVYASVLS